MPRPEGLADILRFNGMVNFLSRFLSNLSDVMKPLRDVNHEDAAWYWNRVFLANTPSRSEYILPRVGPL